MTTYKLKAGSRLSRTRIDPQKVGEHIEALRVKNGGFLSAATIVADARRKRSPLHNAFEWDDTAAAEKYREDQARLLLRVIIRVSDDEDQDDVRAFVHVTVEGRDPYTSIEYAVSDDVMLAELLERATREILTWRRTFSSIKKFASIFNEIDSLVT